MADLLQSLPPVLQALLATCFTWGVTALWAAVIFVSKELSRKTLDLMLGFAGGVMIAVSYWSLLAPAIEMSEGQLFPAWVPATAGFLLGRLVGQSLYTGIPAPGDVADEALLFRGPLLGMRGRDGTCQSDQPNCEGDTHDGPPGRR